jgi:hypothetical protein
LDNFEEVRKFLAEIRSKKIKINKEINLLKKSNKYYWISWHKMGSKQIFSVRKKAEFHKFRPSCHSPCHLPRKNAINLLFLPISAWSVVHY